MHLPHFKPQAAPRDVERGEKVRGVESRLLFWKFRIIPLDLGYNEAGILIVDWAREKNAVGLWFAARTIWPITVNREFELKRIGAITDNFKKR